MAIYVQRRILSIRVGTQQTLMTEMDFKTKNPRVYRCVSFETPEGAIEDGFIKKADVLADSIKEKLKEHKIAVKDVIFTVTSSKIANREVSLPLVPEGKLKKMIHSQATEYFPFELSDYVLTHMVQNQDKKKKMQDILLFAAPNDLIQSYYDLAKKMNSNVMFIDYDGNSAFQILRKQIRENSTSMSIQINTNNCMINIMHGDKLMLQRSIPYGIAPIFEAMMEFEVFNVKTPQAALALLEDQHVLHTHLNNDAIKNMKVNESMLAISDSYRRNLEYESARVDVTDTFSPMINNFIRVIDYYHSIHSEHTIKEIILTGLGTKIAGILDLFNNETGIEVRQLDDLIGVTVDASVVREGYKPIDFISCIGATFQPIGFASLDVVKSETKKNTAMGLTVGAALVVIVALVVVSVSYMQYRSVKEKNDKMERDIESLQSVEKIFATYEATKVKYDVMEDVHLKSYSLNDQFNALLDDITTVMPTNMVINSLKISKDVITLNIESEYRIPTITKMIQQFESIERITDVMIKPIATRTDKVTGEDIYGFSVGFRYKTLEELEEDAKQKELEEQKAEKEASENQQTETNEQ